jgi:hypothetical protein
MRGKVCSRDGVGDDWHGEYFARHRLRMGYKASVDLSSQRLRISDSDSYDKGSGDRVAHEAQKTAGFLRGLGPPVPLENEASHPFWVSDREGHRKVSAHGITDQIDALSFDALDKVRNPVGGGAAIVEAAVIDSIAQPASGAVRDDHMSREQGRQGQPVAGVGQAAVN